MTEPQYIYNASFEEASAEREILGALDQENANHGRAAASTAQAERRSDFYVAFLYRMDPLTREQESVLFRGMNYIKFRAFRLRQRLDPLTATLNEVEAIEALEQQATRIRNYIVESNLRLVTARAKQFARSTCLPLDELISEGNIGLVQAVEHFDYSRGTKLSTYATWAITNKLLAYLHKSRRQKSRLVSVSSDAMEIEDTGLLAAEEQLSNAEVRGADRPSRGQIEGSRADGGRDAIWPGSGYGTSDVEGSGRPVGRHEAAGPAGLCGSGS